MNDVERIKGALLFVLSPGLYMLRNAERADRLRPQKLTVAGGRRTLVDYDDRTLEYRDYNRNRWKYDKQTKQFYNSKLWRETSKQVLLQSNYVCAMCGGEATMTDHIVSIKEDWSKRLDWNNLQASCKACNDAKAIREKHKYK